MKYQSLHRFAVLGLSVATMLGLAVLPAIAGDLSWDAAADFSSVAGENILVNGVWSYGTYNDKAKLYSHFPSKQYDPNGWRNPGLNAWYDAGTGIGLPAVFKNNGDAPIYGLPVGQMGLHPAYPSAEVDQAVLLWTCPAAGHYQFDLSWNYCGGGGGVLVTMTRNLAGSTERQPQVEEDAWNLSAADPAASLLQTFTMEPGETMAFAVAPNADQNSDTTGIALTVTAVPKPPTRAK